MCCSKRRRQQQQQKLLLQQEQDLAQYHQPALNHRSLSLRSLADTLPQAIELPTPMPKDKTPDVPPPPYTSTPVIVNRVSISSFEADRVAQPDVVPTVTTADRASSEVSRVDSRMSWKEWKAVKKAEKKAMKEEKRVWKEEKKEERRALRRERRGRCC